MYSITVSHLLSTQEAFGTLYLIYMAQVKAEGKPLRC